MGRLAFKICALVLALGVVVFIVRASCVRARDPGAQAVREPATPPLASAAAPGSVAAPGPMPASGSAKDAGAARALPEDDSFGIMGPSTKADPHSIRRAVESLAPAPSASAVAPR
ncbi:MAG: hypothetical protein QM820_36945 [Minicystis sp.]